MLWRSRLFVSSCSGNEASPQTPPPPRKRAVPLPRFRFRLRAPRFGELKPAVARGASEGGSRGRVKRLRSRDASAPTFATPFPSKPFQMPPEQRGRRSADRRAVHGPCLRTDAAAGLRDSPLASRRSTAALATQINAMAQPRPRFPRLAPRAGVTRRTLSQSQRCTSHAGHSAGRRDAQAARERGYKPRPRNRTRPIGRLSPVDDPSMGGMILM